MIRKLRHRKLERTKHGYRLWIPKWVPEALLFDTRGNQRIDLTLYWDDERPHEIIIRRSSLEEAYIQADSDETLTKAYLEGFSAQEQQEVQENAEEWRQHLLWSGEKPPQVEKVRSGVLGLSVRESGWYFRLPEEFTLQSFTELGAPKGTGQRTIKKLLDNGLIIESRVEYTGGRGRPRKWYKKCIDKQQQSG